MMPAGKTCQAIMIAETTVKEMADESATFALTPGEGNADTCNVMEKIHFVKLYHKRNCTTTRCTKQKRILTSFYCPPLSCNLVYNSIAVTYLCNGKLAS